MSSKQREGDVGRVVEQHVTYQITHMFQCSDKNTVQGSYNHFCTIYVGDSWVIGPFILTAQWGPDFDQISRFPMSWPIPMMARRRATHDCNGGINISCISLNKS
jgi:hypothetical protein